MPPVFKRIITLFSLALFALAPLGAARAQQTGNVRRIAYLALAPAENIGPMKVLVDRLGELGWFEGQNLAIEYRSAEGDAEVLALKERHRCHPLLLWYLDQPFARYRFFLDSSLMTVA